MAVRAGAAAAGGRTGARRTRGSGGDRASVPSRSGTIGPVSVSALYRGRVRLELLDLLALGEVTHGDIARSLGCRVADVRAFADEHDREISEIRAMLAHDITLDSTSAGLWIASKRARLAEIQADVDDINATIAEMHEFESFTQIIQIGLGSKRHMNLLRLKLAALKTAAEEIDPPRRGAGRPAGNEDAEGANVVHYVIEGDDDIIGSLT
jgi:hypothetical protein